MSLGHGASIVRDGLVFAYDMSNSKKSWKGKPTTNLINNPNFKDMINGLIGWTILDATSITVEPAVYLGRPCIKLTRQPNNTGYDGISNTALDRVISTTYTETISYAIPYTMTQGLRFYLPELVNGVVTNYRHYLTALNNTKGWQTHTVTYTTGANITSWGGYRIDWNTTASTQVETCYIEYLQTEQGTFSTPFVNGTRSNTQALIDWTDNNTITANSLTYSSNGTFEFNGSSDYIQIDQPAISTSPNLWSISFWINPGNQTARFLTPQSAGVDHFLEYDATNQRVNVNITEIADVNNRNKAGTSGSVPINQWSYVTITMDNLSIKIYVNGVLTNQYTETIPIAGWSNQWIIGQRGNSTFWFLGRLSIFKVYNIALTATEVRQNFEALRGRFGI